MDKKDELYELITQMDQENYFFLGFDKENDAPVCINEITEESAKKLLAHAIVRDDFFMSLYDAVNKLSTIYELAHARRLKIKEEMEEQEIH